MIAHLYEVVRHRAAEYPNTIALGSQEGAAWRTLDGRQFLDAVDAVAAELAAKGVHDGDRVMLWLPSGWRTPVYIFALWKLGAIVVPLDREVNPEGVPRITAAVEPRLVITGHGEKAPWAPEGITFEWWDPGTLAAVPGKNGWHQPAEELAAIFYTSGTTGVPKGCMITHANFISQIEAMQDVLALNPSFRLGSILPLSHLYEFTAGMIYPLYMGAQIHYIPSRRPADILRVLNEQKVTHMNAVPQLLTAMKRGLEEQLKSKLPSYVYNLMNAIAARVPVSFRRKIFFLVHKKLGGALVMFTSAGAALPVDVNQFWWRIGIKVLEGYGTSECSPLVSAASPDGSTPMGCVGKPVRGVQVRLSPEGELLVKGPNVFRGYYKDPERTAEVLEDGWYATGDLASIDEKGNIRLLGRAKELIVLPSGMKVWPKDIEDVLRSDPVVKDAAVIGVPSEAGGMTLHAYLLAATGVYKTTVDIPALVARANARLAQHQRLASASWWPDVDFPRTAILKVKKHLLPPPEKVTLAEDQTIEDDDPVGAALFSVAKAATISRGQTLAELGLDSLAITELCAAIEQKTGRFVAEDELRAEMAVGELMDLVERAPRAGAPGQPARAQRQVKYVGPWPYTWGRIFRFLAFPFDLAYRIVATDTIVLGGEHLTLLPKRLIFAGVHHSYADVPLVKHGLLKTPARGLAGRMMIAAAADGFAAAGIFAKYGILALGLYPLERGGLGEESLKQLADLAEKGNPVLIFPQGMHARPAQEIAGDRSARFRSGVARLARDMEAAVVPFGLAGTERAMPPYLEEFKGLVIAGIPVTAKRGPLAIAFGAAVTIAEGENDQQFTERLEKVCFTLTRQAEAALATAEGRGGMTPAGA